MLHGDDFSRPWVSPVPRRSRVVPPEKYRPAPVADDSEDAEGCPTGPIPHRISSDGSINYPRRVSSNRAERKMASLITRWRWPRSNKLHRDLPPTTLWGYGGQFPRPTISEAGTGRTVCVRWQNHLPDEHPAPGGSDDPRRYHSVRRAGRRVVPHLHGGNVNTGDGNRRRGSPVTSNRRVQTSRRKDYYYANEQPPAACGTTTTRSGITRLNVYAGLAGFYLLRNDHEQGSIFPTSDNPKSHSCCRTGFQRDGSLPLPDGRPSDRRG